MGNICKISTTVRAAQTVFEDPVTERRTNVLLNRWRAGEIASLRRIFAESGGKLDKESFLAMFFDLPASYGEAFFKLFDASGTGTVSFRDFCRALSWCCRGDRTERLRFVFCVFCIWENTNSVSTTASSSERCSTTSSAAASHEELALGDLDDDDDADGSEATKLGRAGLQALCDFCGLKEAIIEETSLNFGRFVAWSQGRLTDQVLDLALEPMHTLKNALSTLMLSTPRQEKSRLLEAWSEPVKEGEVVYVLSLKWWTQWRSYVGVEAEAGLERPEEVDNSELEGEAEAELRPNLVENVDYVVCNAKVWAMLLEWYGGGPCFARNRSQSARTVQVELYPLFLRISEYSATSKAKRKLERFERSTTVAQLEILMRERFGRDCRLWYKQADTKAWALLRDKKALEGWSEVMVECKVNGDWPRKQREFRDFRVGDRIDACDYRGKWFAGSVIGLEEDPSKLLVHFDRFAPKWDEWYETNSSKLARPETRAPRSFDDADKKQIVPPSDLAEKQRRSSTSSSTSSTTFEPHDTAVAPEAPSTPEDNEGQSSSSNGLMTTTNLNGSRRKQPNGDCLGARGLLNLGNTCYLNSAVQCLSHTPLLRSYILSERYIGEINRSNPLGTQGRMCEEFAHVLKQLWSRSSEPIAPSKFKRVLSRLKSQFANNEQQDSQEFLGEMLDMLHEDLNRVLLGDNNAESSSSTEEDEEGDEKEAWDRHLLRHRSVIVDLFQGQLRSEKTCQVCKTKSKKFEAFSCLTLPLPAREKTLVVLVIDRGKISRRHLTVPRAGEMADLKKAVHDSDDREIVIADVYRHRISKVFEDSEVLVALRDDEVLVAYVEEEGWDSRIVEPPPSPKAAGEDFPSSLRDLRVGTRLDALDKNGEWFVGSVVALEPGSARVHYDRFSSKWDEWFSEADWHKCAPPLTKSAKPARRIDLHVVHCRESTGEPSSRSSVERTPARAASARSTAANEKRMELFGLPLVMRVSSDRSCRAIEAAVTERCLVLAGSKSSRRVKQSSTASFKLRIASLSNPLAQRTNPELSATPKSRICDVFDERRCCIIVDWTDPDAYNDPLPGLEESSPAEEPVEKEVRLSTCLDAFVREETLTEDDCWFCPKCKERRPAVSTIQPWKLPDILVIHLKRFLFLPTWREKIRTNVTFPLHSLDMSAWTEDLGVKKPCLFDLFAVTNHIGRLEGGHYTSFVRAVPCSPEGVEDVASPFPADSDEEFRWLHFDDEVVEEVPASAVVTENAYVLFYRKRKLTPSTVINLSNFGSPSPAAAAAAGAPS